MREAEKVKIYAAVQSCLARCYGAANPLVQATNFVAELRENPTWREAEVGEVELLVFRAVQVIVRQPRSGCCHGSLSESS
jgi:hypothetical protein